MAQTWVHEGVEVVKTGREAVREVQTMRGETIKRILVEIKPLDESADWKKWVDPSQLFVVQ
jgi:hypothetical protein